MNDRQNFPRNSLLEMFMFHRPTLFHVCAYTRRAAYVLYEDYFEPCVHFAGKIARRLLPSLFSIYKGTFSFITDDPHLELHDSGYRDA